MLQLIGYLLCFYLVFKDFEIYQIALASPREHRGAAMTIGALAVVGSIILAALFAFAFAMQGASTPGYPMR